MRFSDVAGFRALAAAVTLAAALAFSGGAQATPLPAVFFIGGLFDDGGTLNGQFGIDVYGFNDKTQVNLTTSTGTTLSGQTYLYPSSDPQIHPSLPMDANSLSWVDVVLSPYRELHLAFVGNINEAVLPDTSSPTTFLPLTIDFAHSYECYSYSCPGPTSDGGTTRYLISGGIGMTPESVAGLGETPLPGALPLFATGMGMLGLAGWRRRKRVASTRA